MLNGVYIKYRDYSNSCCEEHSFWWHWCKIVRNASINIHRFCSTCSDRQEIIQYPVPSQWSTSSNLWEVSVSVVDVQLFWQVFEHGRLRRYLLFLLIFSIRSKSNWWDGLGLGWGFCMPSCWNTPVNMIYKEMDFPVRYNSMNQVSRAHVKAHNTLSCPFCAKKWLKVTECAWTSRLGSLPASMKEQPGWGLGGGVDDKWSFKIACNCYTRDFVARKSLPYYLSMLIKAQQSIYRGLKRWQGINSLSNFLLRLTCILNPGFA